MADDEVMILARHFISELGCRINKPVRESVAIKKTNHKTPLYINAAIKTV